MEKAKKRKDVETVAETPKKSRPDSTPDPTAPSMAPTPNVPPAPANFDFEMFRNFQMFMQMQKAAGSGAKPPSEPPKDFVNLSD